MILTPVQMRNISNKHYTTKAVIFLHMKRENIQQKNIFYDIIIASDYYITRICRL